MSNNQNEIEIIPIARVNELGEFCVKAIVKKMPTKVEIEKINTQNDATLYWNQYPFKELLRRSRFHELREYVLEVLSEVKKICPTKYKEIHKGNPFYWLGMTSYLLRNYQSATFFMTAAVKEDLEIFDDSPSKDFIQLKGSSERQAAKKLVEEAESILENYTNLYNGLPQIKNKLFSEIKVADIRISFLEKATNKKIKKYHSEASAFISFFLEHGTLSTQLSIVDNPLSKDIFLLHLLKGCILLESLLKAITKFSSSEIYPTTKNGKKKEKKFTLIDYYNKNRKVLGIKNGLPTSANSLKDVFDLIPIQKNEFNNIFSFVGKIRNTISHFIGWDTSITTQIYDEAFELITLSCIHVINSLYRNQKA
jgi:hypothetical protein